MRKTTLLAATALLLGTAGRTLAQNTPAENNSNLDAPYVRNIRPDRPGQTITAHVLHPGQFQLETGLLRQSPKGSAASTLSAATLRIGFFNSMELRVTQAYRPGGGSSLPPSSGENPARARADSAGWAPLLVGTKLMLSPNPDTRTQVALLAETTVPGTGQVAGAGWAPAARLLVGQQLGQRYGLEANLGFGQRGLKVKDVEQGVFLGALSLNGPLGEHAGFFVEAYGQGRAALSTGGTLGLYWRPTPGLRLDVNGGRLLGGPATGSGTVGAGLAWRLGQ
ncbi:hypothetical protein [uncultured Hymenobacter sp.]|uniref:hypothetical protein n=1 Tax=uncultured Hymenobacter sp. TaxID=170016 RepID=UPI0035CC3591